MLHELVESARRRTSLVPVLGTAAERADSHIEPRYTPRHKLASAPGDLRALENWSTGPDASIKPGPLTRARVADAALLRPRGSDLTHDRNSIQREHIEELTSVGPDAAIVRFCSVLTGSEQSPNEPIRSRKFLVVTRRQGVWKVSWGQNTRLRADVPESECFATLRKHGG